MIKLNHRLPRLFHLRLEFIRIRSVSLDTSMFITYFNTKNKKIKIKNNIYFYNIILHHYIVNQSIIFRTNVWICFCIDNWKYSIYRVLVEHLEYTIYYIVLLFFPLCWVNNIYIYYIIDYIVLHLAHIYILYHHIRSFSWPLICVIRICIFIII
jgi:hypothetical protein